MVTSVTVLVMALQLYALVGVIFIVSYLLLTDAQGQPVNDRVLDLVAEPIEITGRLLRMGGRLVLQSDPDTYRRDF